MDMILSCQCHFAGLLVLSAEFISWDGCMHHGGLGFCGLGWAVFIFTSTMLVSYFGIDRYPILILFLFVFFLLGFC